jgi:hypothetical protein
MILKEIFSDSKNNLILVLGKFLVLEKSIHHRHNYFGFYLIAVYTFNIENRFALE